MHPLGPEFASKALRQRAQRVFGAGESGKAGSATQARGRAGEQDRPPAPRSHDPRRLAAREEPGEGRHLPDLGVDLRGRFDDGKADVGADVENQNLDRPDGSLDLVEEGDGIGLVARVEPERMRFAAFGADAFGERLQRLEVARAARHDDGQTLAGEGARDRRAEAVARSDDDTDAAAAFSHGMNLAAG